MEDSGSGPRNLRWKLRSSTKRSSYREEESSAEESEEVEEVGGSADEGHSSADTSTIINRGSKGAKSGAPKPRGANKYKKARRSAGSPQQGPQSTKPSAQKKEANKERSIASYFRGKSPVKKVDKEKEERDRRIEAERRAFLTSGVPEVVVRAQKVVDKRIEEDQQLASLAFFPTITLVNGRDDTSPSKQDLDLHLTNPSISFKSLDYLNVGKEHMNLTISSTSIFSTIVAKEQKLSSHLVSRNMPLCCQSSFDSNNVQFHIPPQEQDIIVMNEDVKSNPYSPWIEKYRVEKLKSLVGETKSLNKLHKWLKQWNCDIKDDGGTGRKLVEKKKKRRDSDSDFVTSEDDDDEFKKKSVLLDGPPGSGKTAAVNVIAKHFGFHVVEVNFSSRRSGKEVLQRVEEAVVSHRLQSSQNCLLLFKDIDLLNSEEDEGFHAAVAQLITNAVRPIVMTTCKRSFDAIDPKIEKKDPLRISFSYPKSSRIVQKILLPIFDIEAGNPVQSPRSPNNNNINDNPSSSEELVPLLTSLSRHARCDIRQVINQAQFIFSSSNQSKRTVTFNRIHEHLLGGRENYLHLGFVIPNPKLCAKSLNSEDSDSLLSLTIKGRRKKELKELEKSSETLSWLCDLDCMEGWMDGRLERNQLFQDEGHEEEDRMNQKSKLKANFSTPNFLTVLNKNFGSSSDSKGLDIIRRLMYDTDDDISRAERISELSGTCGEYFDVGGDGLWDSLGWFRTIVKQNVMDSAGRLAKRNGRMTYYFNRMDREFIDKISDTFGFQDDLEIAKSILRQTDS